MKQNNQIKKAVVEFTAKITDQDGNVIEKTVTVPADFPSMEDFDICTKEGFLNDFDAFEKAVLQARNQATEDISNAYLDSVSKKNRGKKSTEDKPQ